MNTRKFWVWKVVMVALLLYGLLPLAGCSSNVRVGETRTETQTVELGGDRQVRAEIDLGAGDLELTGGAAKLLETNFNYNVDRLKPEVKYKDGFLVVRQPESKGLPVLHNITNFRNEWGLRFYNEVPLDLSINVGAGTSNLQLASMTLTRLNVTLGAGKSTVDLSGGWARDLDVSFDTGAADLSLRLPKDIGVRVDVDDGPSLVEASGLTKDGNVYTNAAYGASAVTLRVHMKAGIGRINLEVAE